MPSSRRRQPRESEVPDERLELASAVWRFDPRGTPPQSTPAAELSRAMHVPRHFGAARSPVDSRPEIAGYPAREMPPVRHSEDPRNPGKDVGMSTPKRREPPALETPEAPQEQNGTTPEVIAGEPSASNPHADAVIFDFASGEPEGPAPRPLDAADPIPRAAGYDRPEGMTM